MVRCLLFTSKFYSKSITVTWNVPRVVDELLYDEEEMIVVHNRHENRPMKPSYDHRMFHRCTKKLDMVILLVNE